MEKARLTDATLTGLRRSLIRPVSRIGFDVTDRAAFDSCVQLAVQWMEEAPRRGKRPRSGIALPPEAKRGESFDVSDVLGANPTKALRLEASDRLLWTARLDFPDPEQPRSWVSEFFVERKIGERVRFGAQLTCVMRSECAPFEPTRPRLVQHILESLSCEADGRSLSDTIVPTDVRDVHDLIALMYQPDRRLPVIVCSAGEGADPELSATRLAKRIGGGAHIFELTDDASWELSRSVGRRMSVFNGAIRLYNPGLTDDAEDPFDHPLWIGQSRSSKSLQRQIADRVLRTAFLNENPERPFHRYARVRELATRRVLEQRVGDEADQLKAEVALLEEQSVEYLEERDTWQSLAQAEQDRRVAAEREVERLKLEVKRLEAKAAAIQFGYASSSDNEPDVSSDRKLDSYADLEEWAEEVLRDAVIIHQAALRDCRKNGHPNMIERIEKALIIMRDYMTPSRRSNDVALRDEGERRLGELGMRDSGCFVNRDEARKSPGYSVNYEGDSRVLYDHIKYGKGYDNANQIRIYYFWDEDRKRHVVGKMPSHMKNNLTN
ncbi:MAG: hypothetical protein ACI9YM_001681 [Brevundimonas sp.]|jgi:hypothetical protein